METQNEKNGKLKDRTLREQDSVYRDLAEADAAANWLCWGERLLLRSADMELQGIRQNHRTPSRGNARGGAR